MTPSPVAPDENNNNFLGLHYRVGVGALNDCATVTRYMKGSIGFVVQEPEVTDDFKQFPIIIYGSNWVKKVLSYPTMIIEQLYALITGYGKLTSRMKRVCLNQFDWWSPNQLPVQLKGLAESGGFLEIESAFGHCSRWRGITLRYIYIPLLYQCCVKVRWKLRNNKYPTTILSHNK